MTSRQQVTFRALGAAFAAAAFLAACGGDNFDNPPVTSQVPDSASLSVGGFIAYLQALVVSSADMPW